MIVHAVSLTDQELLAGGIHADDFVVHTAIKEVGHDEVVVAAVYVTYGEEFLVEFFCFFVASQALQNYGAMGVEGFEFFLFEPLHLGFAALFAGDYGLEGVECAEGFFVQFVPLLHHE